MTTDTKTTIFGLVMAVGVAIVTFMQTGLDLKNPLWWVGIVTAAAAGAKGFYTNKP